MLPVAPAEVVREEEEEVWLHGSQAVLATCRRQGVPTQRVFLAAPVQRRRSPKGQRGQFRGGSNSINRMYTMTSVVPSTFLVPDSHAEAVDAVHGRMVER